MIKQYISKILRSLRLLEFTDYIKFLISFLKNYKTNKSFKANNKDILLPPNFILYESFGMLKYDSYFINGRKSIDYLIGLLEEHILVEKDLTICEWGCGPARLIRHFSESIKQLGYNAECHGTDYNSNTISWCKKNINTAIFSLNELNPPLKYKDNKFDILYSISVFTHLSEELQINWFKECLRIIKHDGLYLFTVHGDMQSKNLLPSEKEQFEERGIYIRDKVQEGKRNFAAYNSEKYMRQVLLKDVTIVRYIKSKSIKEQDLWIIRKNSGN